MPPTVIEGIGVSPGIAIGIALVVERGVGEIPERDLNQDDLESELARIDDAVEVALTELVTAEQRAGKEVGEVHIWGPEGVEEFLEILFQKRLFPVALDAHPFAIRVHELSRRMTHTVRGTKVRAILQPEHPGGSLGYRFDREGKSIAILTDTVVNMDRVPFAKKADLLIHECYFRDIDADQAVKTGHSHSTPVGEFAVAAQVHRLALMHINPLDVEPEFCLREVMEQFNDTFLAYDKMEITV